MNLSLERLKNIEIILFSNESCSDSKIPRNKSQNKSLLTNSAVMQMLCHAKAYFKHSLSQNQEPIWSKILHE